MSAQQDGPLVLVPPYSEEFAPGKAGAFSLFIAETTPLSRFKSVIEVFGRPVETPFPGIGFKGVTPGFALSFSRNRRFAAAVLRALRGASPALVEVFNRPEIFLSLARAMPSVPMALHLGNDPLAMKRARAPAIRQEILERAAGIWCCSQFICERFADGLTGDRSRLRPLYSGAPRPAARPQKQPLILYVGRLIEEKGVMELAGALARVLPLRPGWRAGFIGANRPGGTAELTVYEREVHARLAGLGDQVRFHGFLPAAEVQEIMAGAAIVVVPSKWDEPMGRTAIEGLANGCAVVAGNRGGLREIVRERGILLDDVTAVTLGEVLARLMDDEIYLKSAQDRAWADFPFELPRFVANYDAWRTEAMAWRPGT